MSGSRKQRFAEDELIEFADGEVVFAEGDDTREMFVVVSGRVVISKGNGSESVILATLRKGQFFGEMALLESLPRNATATARGHAKVLAVQPGGFLLKIRRDPTFAYEMLQQLSRRLRLADDWVTANMGHGSTRTTLLREGVPLFSAPTQLGEDMDDPESDA